MKVHKHLIALIIFASATLTTAQQDPLGTPPRPISGEYSSSEGRFKVFFHLPCTLNEAIGPVETKLGKVNLYMLLCPTPTITYTLMYTEYPIDLDTPDLVKRTLDSARESSLSRVAKEDPQVKKESEISVEGNPGRFLQVELKGDAMVRMRYFVKANRLYVFGVGTPKKIPPVIDATNDYEAIATRFMDSFKLITPLEADNTGPWKEFSSPGGKFKVLFPGTPLEASVPAGSSGHMHVASYKSAALYSAMYLDYMETPKDFVAVMELLDNLRLGEFETAVKNGQNPKLLSECSISHEGFPGRLLVLENSNNQIYRRKVVLVKNRVYIVTATAPKDDSGNKSYEALSLKFLDSFRLMDQPVKN